MATKQSTSLGKIILGTIIGLVIFSALVVIFWFSLLITSAMAVSEKKKEIYPNSVLKITLDKPIVEHNVYNFKFNFLSPQKSIPIGLDDIVEAIHNAKDNDDIAGIFLDLRMTTSDIATLNEIRQALIDFKESGKFIIAHSDNYFPNSYFLASVADKIYMTPTGNFIWKGFASQILYYKTALQKLNIEPIVVRHGKYKSAVEPFIQDTISPQNKEQIQEFLDDYWFEFLSDVAQARNLDVKMLKLYADSLMISSGEKAVQLKLIDNLKFRTDVLEEIKQMLNLDKKEKIKFVSYSDLLDNSTKSAKNKIAIVYAEGSIVDGYSFKNQKIVSHYYEKIFKKLDADSSVKAIVFRVNSPGGSALASEIILHQMLETQKHKPIVVSMGKYAASGGYYISCNADYIFAEPYTLTGSIGVLGIFFNINPLLKNKLGITVNTVKSSPYADLMSPLKRPTPTEINFIRNYIENTYKIFISHVAKGRNLDTNYVDSIAQGRIWSAIDAKNLGLIDEIGTLNDAIEKAANIAGIANQKYVIVEYPSKKSFLSEFLSSLEDEVKLIYNLMFGNYNSYSQLKEQLKEYEGIQARLPFEIVIE